MATLEVQETGSPVLTLKSSEFLRILRAYPLAEGFPFRLMASTTEIEFEICPGGTHSFEPVRGGGIQLKCRRSDIGALDKASFTVDNLILRVEDGTIRLSLATQTPAKIKSLIIVSIGWSDPPDVVRTRLARLKQEGMARYTKQMRSTTRSEERERQERDQAAQAERDRQEELRKERVKERRKAARNSPEAVLARERAKARRNMEKLQEQARANLEARTAAHARAGASALGDPGETSGGKPKVRNKAATV